MELINHIKRWNKWRKYKLNSWWWRLLVLFGLAPSPTFDLVLTDAQTDKIFKRFYIQTEGIDNYD